jgi:hypothetical protein
MPDRYKNYRPVAPKAPPSKKCTCHPVAGQSTCIIDHPVFRVDPLKFRQMHLRTPLLKEWAKQCMIDFQVLYGHGFPEVIISIKGDIAEISEFKILSSR